MTPNDAVISSHVRRTRSRYCAAAREKEREEDQVRDAEVRRVGLTGHGERERHPFEDAFVMVDDRVRRPAPNRVGVDPRDDQRDDDDPRLFLEEVEEDPAEERRSAELRKGRRPLPVQEREPDRQTEEDESDEPAPRHAVQRQQEPDRREHGGDDEHRDDGDVPPQRQVAQVLVQREVRREHRSEHANAAMRRGVNTAAARPTTGRAP